MRVYYAARSRAKLETVCETLSATFGLPPFEFDSHDDWRWGGSEGQNLGLNVTRSQEFRTIEAWMPGCPPGVNYQVILTAESEPIGFASRLAEILSSEVIRYATSDRQSEA